MRDNKTYSKFEKVRILGTRALQLSQGAPYMIKVPSKITKPLEIAKLEWEASVIPIEIKRHINQVENNSINEWKG